MPFTEEQRLDISDILGITPDELNTQIAYLGDRLTATVESRILAKVAQWPSVSGSHTSFTPTESNKGFNLNSSSAKDAIRKSIANWLQIDGVGFSTTIQIERG